MPLETIDDALATGFKRLEPASFQTAAELTNARRTNPEVREVYFYTADFAMYTVEDGEAILYFGGREMNPVLKNIDTACEQLAEEEKYSVPEEDKQAAIYSDSTLRMKLSELGLDEDGCLTITVTDNKTLKPAQRALAEKVFGKGDDFIKNMERFVEEYMLVVKVKLLTPEYVKENVPEGEAIALPCWLEDFYLGSNFYADNREVREKLSLRGELKPEVDEEHAHLRAAYDAILANPEESVRALSPEVYSGLLNILLDYKITEHDP